MYQQSTASGMYHQPTTTVMAQQQTATNRDAVQNIENHLQEVCQHTININKQVVHMISCLNEAKVHLKYVEAEYHNLQNWQIRLTTDPALCSEYANQLNRYLVVLEEQHSKIEEANIVCQDIQSELHGAIAICENSVRAAQDNFSDLYEQSRTLSTQPRNDEDIQSCLERVYRTHSCVFNISLMNLRIETYYETSVHYLEILCELYLDLEKILDDIFDHVREETAKVPIQKRKQLTSKIHYMRTVVIGDWREINERKLTVDTMINNINTGVYFLNTLIEQNNTISETLDSAHGPVRTLDPVRRIYCKTSTETTTTSKYLMGNCEY